MATALPVVPVDVVVDGVPLVLAPVVVVVDVPVPVPVDDPGVVVDGADDDWATVVPFAVVPLTVRPGEPPTRPGEPPTRTL